MQVIQKHFLDWQFTIPADATLIFDIQLISMQWISSYQLKNVCSQPAVYWIRIDLLHPMFRAAALCGRDNFSRYDCIYKQLSTYSAARLNCWCAKLRLAVKQYSAHCNQSSCSAKCYCSKMLFQLPCVSTAVCVLIWHVYSSYNNC